MSDMFRARSVGCLANTPSSSSSSSSSTEAKFPSPDFKRTNPIEKWFDREHPGPKNEGLRLLSDEEEEEEKEVPPARRTAMTARNDGVGDKAAYFGNLVL